MKERDDVDILSQFFLPYAKCMQCPRFAAARASIERLPDGTDTFSEEWSSVGMWITYFV